ncbi:MAG: ATP-binding protein [Bacteroidales bacterium]|nr:ATP-binding protein [Bacteroidales bacterium]MDT8432119.1 ATP-binding protein [Bacteroidales bacterium]
MRILDFKRIDNWIVERLKYPGIDEKQLIQRKIYFHASVAVTSMIGLLTLTYHLIFPELRILIWYGTFLVLVFSQGIVVPLFFKKRSVSVLWRLIDQTLVAVATFVAVLLMGGIPHSGGLILVGLGLVFFSLNINHKSGTIAIFIIYVISVILLGVLHPYLSVPAEMTEAVNISLFVINILWISGFAFVFVMNFISLRVKIEKKEADRVKALDEARSHLYTNITHEFRTPLTVIKGMTELMREDVEEWKTRGPEKIEENADLLLRLVNQMLDLAKLEAGAMPVKMTRADIHRFIAYVIELHASAAAAKNIDLVCTPGAGDPVLDFDPDKLMQILSNLLSNALKFTPRKGRIEVSTSIENGNRYRIRVSDTGPGIPKEEIGFVFDRFYRIDHQEIQYQPGSGLGLSLVQEMVKLLQGEIETESEEGIGTVFTVSLPLTRTHPPAAIDRLESPGYLPADRSARVIDNNPAYQAMVHQDGRPLLLIVEDNIDVCAYLSTLLQQEYAIIVASNGKEGCDQAVKHIPDIIISDIMMPEMDGIEMLDRLKNDVRTSHIPVVMLTAKADIDSRLAGLDCGADAYLTKPFNKNELMVQLRSLISLRKKLHERYASMLEPALSKELDLRHEDAFMLKMREVMLRNLHDESLDVSMLCTEVGMSRTQLYRKFKSLSDKTIHEYLRTLRLFKAKEMLLHTDKTVAEVAYHTGFKNMSHFSKVFTSEFNINPSRIRQS